MAQYKIYGTNEPYSGMVVEVGGYLYTTDGGTLQGDSYQLIPTANHTNVPNANLNTDNNPNFANNSDNQRVVVTSGTGNGVTPTRNTPRNTPRNTSNTMSGGSSY